MIKPAPCLEGLDWKATVGMQHGTLPPLLFAPGGPPSKAQAQVDVSAKPRGSLFEASSNRVVALVPTTHNTAVLGPVAGPAEASKRKEMLAAWFRATRPDSRILVELDRAVMLPLTMPKGCHLTHMGDAVMDEDTFLAYLKDLASKATIVILYDFKRNVVLTKKDKTSRCIGEWQRKLASRGIDYEERDASLHTQGASKCGLLAEQTTVKTYNDGRAAVDVSPLYDVVACDSTHLAFDVWSFAKRDSLIRAMHLGADGMVGEVTVDYTPTNVRLLSNRSVEACYMGIDQRGDVEMRIAVGKGASHGWTTAGSTCAFAIRHGGAWISGRAMPDPAAPFGWDVRMDVVASSIPFSFSLEGAEADDEGKQTVTVHVVWPRDGDIAGAGAGSST